MLISRAVFFPPYDYTINRRVIEGRSLACLSIHSVAYLKRHPEHLAMKLPPNPEKVLLYVILAACAAGCAGQREPAKLALEEINITMEIASPDALKYLPDQTIFVQKEVAKLNASYGFRDYATVVTDSPAILLDAKLLVAAATIRKQNAIMVLAQEWTTLDKSLPPLFAAVRTRLESLSKMRHPPKGIELTAAQLGIAQGSALWDKGHAAFSAGQLEEAVAFLKDAKVKVESAATALQLSLLGITRVASMSSASTVRSIAAAGHRGFEILYGPST